MKRLSLFAFAMTVLISASGCCCGLCHGLGNNCCGYGGGGGCSSCGQAYPMAAPSCPTCPNGGCAPSGPVFQGTSFFGPADAMQASAMPQAPQALAGSPTLASATPLPTY
jgi:hypothetical protein